MASIFYSMAGEGRGHATRARTVVEALRHRHKVTLFASDCAYAMLAPIYKGTDIDVVSIPGLGFAYGRSGQVALGGTLWAMARFRLALKQHVQTVLPVFERTPPDLVVGDFEPLLPRAARACGVPFVSFDHQHYLVVGDLSELPFRLRHQAATIAPFVQAMYDWQVGTIVSSFYSPPLKPAYADATMVGPLIRPEIRRLCPRHGGHVLVYMRRFASPQVLAALAACGREVFVYGLGEQPRQGRLRFFAIDERRFVEHLATCHALVSTAGNQLVGEALYLRKPILVMPEARNFEQAVNAHFLELTGAGWSETGVVTPKRLRAFLDAADVLRARIRPEAACGNDEALAALLGYLPRTSVSGAARAGEAAAALGPRAQWA